MLPAIPTRRGLRAGSARRLADAPRLAALSAVLGYPSAEDVIRARLARLLGPGVGPRAGGRIRRGRRSSAGYTATEQELLESERRCEILGLVVDPASRPGRRGAGWSGRSSDGPPSRGLELIAVRSNVTRAESHPFYERLGYVRIKTQHAYRKRLAGARSASGPSRRSRRCDTSAPRAISRQTTRRDPHHFRWLREATSCEIRKYRLMSGMALASKAPRATNRPTCKTRRMCTLPPPPGVIAARPMRGRSYLGVQLGWAPNSPSTTPIR